VRAFPAIVLHESIIEIARYTAVMDFIISLTDGDITSGTAKPRSQGHGVEQG